MSTTDRSDELRWFSVSLALVAAEVLLAISDRRALVRRGVIKPLHPG